MKRLEFEKLKSLDIVDLNKILKEKKGALLKLRFDFEMGKTKNIAEIKKLKKDIAQILTLINEKIKNKQ